MIVAGIDIGSETAKAVLLNDDIIASKVIPIEEEARYVAARVLREAIKKAGLNPAEIGKIVVTGLDKKDWEMADESITEVSCAVKGAFALFPNARTIINMGAESCIVARCDENGLLVDYAINHKCGSGSGIFLEIAAKALEVDIEQMGELSLESKNNIEMTSTCAVFAESEVVSFIHNGVKKEDIIKAIHDSLASRTASMVKSVGLEQDVIFIGGVSRNMGMAEALSRQLEAKVLVPEEPETVVAFGAALAAKEILNAQAKSPRK